MSSTVRDPHVAARRPFRSPRRFQVAGVVVAALAVTTAACAGAPDHPGASRPGAPPAPAAAANATATTSAADEGGSVPSGSTNPFGPVLCATVVRLYAGLVAVPLGLVTDADPSDRTRLEADTARLRGQVPAPVAHDLEVLARAEGLAVRALDEAGSGPGGAGVGTDAQLDQADAALRTPAVTAATADLRRRMQAHCP